MRISHLESDARRFTFHVKVTLHLSGFYNRLARADSRSKPRVWLDLTVTFALLPFLLSLVQIVLFRRITYDIDAITT